MPATKPIATLNWYDVPDPASRDLDELAQRFHLHELQIEDTRHEGQRAKVEEHDTYVFAVIKKLHTTEEVHFHDFCIFLGPDFLITVHKGSNEFINTVRHRAEQNQITRIDRLFH